MLLVVAAVFVAAPHVVAAGVAREVSPKGTTQEQPPTKTRDWRDWMPKPSQELHCYGLARKPKPLADTSIGAVVSHFAENM
jgi:hypothetical protein